MKGFLAAIKGGGVGGGHEGGHESFGAGHESHVAAAHGAGHESHGAATHGVPHESGKHKLQVFYFDLVASYGLYYTNTVFKYML